MWRNIITEAYTGNFSIFILVVNIIQLGVMIMGKVTHGDHDKTAEYHPLYQVWKSMKKRCSNPKAQGYRNYGGRGIKVCEEWEEYPRFKMDLIALGWAPGLQMDRIDNNKGYSPDNVRCVTVKQNSQNRRTNRWITYRGETMTLPEWADRLQVNVKALHKRIFTKGWTIEDAFTRPGLKKTGV